MSLITIILLIFLSAALLGIVAFLNIHYAIRFYFGIKSNFTSNVMHAVGKAADDYITKLKKN